MLKLLVILTLLVQHLIVLDANQLLEAGEKTVEIATIEVEIPSFEVYEITAYTAGVESTGKTPDHPEYGITASGKKVQENHTIACPKSMEFGTAVYIPHFDNTFYCEDRGGAIVDGHIDVYMPDLQEALDFGRRKLEVKIIAQAGGEDRGSDSGAARSDIHCFSSWCLY